MVAKQAAVIIIWGATVHLKKTRQLMSHDPPNASARRYLRIDRRQIAYFKFTLEAYEGVALMRTIDAHLGTVELLIGPGCEGVVDGLIKDLSARIKIEDIGAGR